MVFGMHLTQSLREHFRSVLSITDGDFEDIVSEANHNAICFALRIIKQGLVDRHVAGNIIANALGFGYIQLDKDVFDNEVVTRLQHADALSLQAIAVHQKGEHIVIATDIPNTLDPQSLTQHALDKILVMFTFPDELEAAIADYYQPLAITKPAL